MDSKAQKGLPPAAYEVIPGSEYKPYVPETTTTREFTIRALITGILFGILFGAANAYLGLRVGLTISTSIPIAVLTVLAFVALPPFGRLGSILEANISQTVGSASSSLASGMIFTIPALFLWGQTPSLGKVIVISLTGGLLGVLFMIPLRRFLIRDEHGKLPYPEGTACAEVLVAADRGGAESMPIFKGILIAGLIKFLGSAMHLWKHIFTVKIPLLRNAQIGLEAGPALLGVGYILGFRIAFVMVAGGLLSSLVLIPALSYWGWDRMVPLYPETEKLIRDMTPGLIWTRYIRYIGAGAVACGGILSLIRSIPTIWGSFRVGFAQLKARTKGHATSEKRTDQDLSMVVVLVGVVVLIIFMASVPHVLGFLPSVGSRLLSGFLMAVLAFFFVTVSSRIVGLVGVTSNPTSGMTIAALLVTSGVFLLFNWTGPEGMAQALVIGAVVATAASMAGDTSQDLKTGFLLGATPWRQQIGEMLGIATSVTFVVLALFALEKVYGFGTAELPAPQATLMKLVIEGVLSQSIPWGLVLIGMGIALVAAICRVPALPFAVGIYLPVSTMTPVFVGGLLRFVVEHMTRKNPEALLKRREKGVLFGSGLVGGEGLVGVGIAIFALFAKRRPAGIGPEWVNVFGLNPKWEADLMNLVPLLVFVFLGWLLFRTTKLKK